MDEETTVEDDHMPFLKAGVPSLDIIDLDYPQWHTAAGHARHRRARAACRLWVMSWSRRCPRSKQRLLKN